eukprot:5750578-Amphidinium_carterae.1
MLCLWFPTGAAHVALCKSVRLQDLDFSQLQRNAHYEGFTEDAPASSLQTSLLCSTSNNEMALEINAL